MSDERAQETPKTRATPALVSVSMIVITIWAAGGWLVYQWGPPEKAGEFGDMFGAVNSLFTGLAFAALIVTIRFQSRELELQRLELSATRKELAGQRAHMESQARTMRAQAADANFFRLLEMFRRMASEVQHPGQPEKGVEYWRRLVEFLHSDEEFQQSRDGSGSLLPAWNNFFTEWEQTLGPYFASLDELLDLLKSAEDLERERHWSAVLRSQLTPNEMIVMFYHANHPRGSGLKVDIERLALFKYFPSSETYPENTMRKWFAHSAFDPRWIDIPAH